MTSRNRLIAVVAVLCCAVVAAAVYALLGTGKTATTSSHSPKAGAGTTSGAPAVGGSSGGPKPSAPPKPSGSSTWVPTNSAIADVCRSKLPTQARDTLGLIAKGGPYPYRTDGVVFENRESRLPRHSNGYYHEYTVVTPGSGDRGTRRVVTGTDGEQYWTDDHYGTFQEIDSRC
ncbi:ribonuclease [Kitasatospora sp. GP82]|uniref:ribonuclease n=1 Tax=Kitasatospora sp. GP82 TaxID=3035089 RepID=UPI00247588C1|nr:ribonuclease [Kitasatospora sp. GP82]MDH6125272.1 ribonuclease T1 [Kitasatospora sp. GP82]